jgi:protein TonB
MLTEMAVFDEAVWNGEAPSPVAVAAQSNSEAQQAFIRGMLEMPTQQDTRNPLELVVSVVLHAIIIAAILIAPLIFTGTINLGRFEQTFLVAPPPPAAAPPPAQAEKVVKAMSRPIPTQAITQPVVIPAKIRIVHDAAPPDPGTLGVIGGVSGGDPNGVLGGIIGGTSSIAVPPPPPAHHDNEIYRVGGDVKPPQLIYGPAPVYPPLARTSRIEGTVLIDAVINEAGDVVQERAISGPGLLMHAALMAVSRWRYQPTYLDGQAVSIRMHVTVKFHLQ